MSAERKRKEMRIGREEKNECGENENENENKER